MMNQKEMLNEYLKTTIYSLKVSFHSLFQGTIQNVFIEIIINQSNSFVIFHRFDNFFVFTENLLVIELFTSTWFFPPICCWKKGKNLHRGP